MCSMDEICGILDFDGFNVCGHFLTREAGFASMNEDALCISQSFLLPDSVLETCSEKDRRTISFTARHIHGLDFKPKITVPWIKPHAYLQTFVNLCHENSANSYQNVVAFKGGSVEKQILEQLDIPSVNLEDFGCPKFDSLAEDVEDSAFVKYSCIEHKNLSSFYYHCPKLEVAIFRRWLRARMLRGSCSFSS